MPKTKSKTKEDTTMNKEKMNVSRNIETLEGKKIKREAVAYLPVFEKKPESANEFVNPNAVTEFFGDDLLAYAVIGYKTRVRQFVLNALGGNTGLDKKQRSAMRQFRSHIKTMTEIMNLSGEQAVETLLKNEKFSNLNAAVEALKDTSNLEFDYSATRCLLPGADEEDDDENENEETTEE